MVTQRELALQMLGQLRLLDPSISAEVGTPERKIIDTVAESLADSQIDLEALSASLDIDSKYGAGLDRFFRLFGFARQQATFATGYVTLSRVSASNFDIRIPAGTPVEASGTQGVPSDGSLPASVRFATVYDVVLPAGDLSIVAAIRSTISGTIGNVSASTITDLSSSNIYGITGAINEIPTQGGVDSESDEEFKVRFKNTLFRNLAGTQDQYMALSIATAFTTKANVIGPQSRYKEYVQVPPVADNASYDVNADGLADAGGGNAGEYTTALSTIPFAKYIYATEVPAFVANSDPGPGSLFYRQDYDFVINNTAATKARGDSYRLGATGLDWSFYGSSGLQDTYPPRPNITFKNVYTGTDITTTSVRPGDTVLFDFAYMSDASRNDYSLKITNCVDVFIDGGNETITDTVIVRPSAANVFVDDPTSKFHYENYRRVGYPQKRPLTGNILTPMFWQPTLDLPDSIVIASYTYYKGIHYWAIEDVSSIGGTVRARSGIEWSVKTFSQSVSDTYNATDPSAYTGQLAQDSAGDPVGGQTLSVTGYTFDRNIVDLQAALEGSKQVTTDILAHRAKKRYFKLDVSVMYASGASISDTNANIRSAVDAYLKTQYFGTFIQLSDLLTVIHNVSGVDNVRWTADAPGNTTLTTKVYECDINGKSLTGVYIDRVQTGSAGGYGGYNNVARPEVNRLYLIGRPTTVSFTLTIGANTSAPITAFANGNILTGLTSAPLSQTITSVLPDSRTTAGVRLPISSQTITWTSSPCAPVIMTATSACTGGDYLFKYDFPLRDDELAMLPTGMDTGDTVAGLIIRPRAQNTWNRSI